jgi:hypothetical protein
LGSVGARDVKDDFGLLFFDGAVSVEKLAGDVSEDSGAPGSDFVLGEQKQETREEGVDLDGIGEVVEAGGKGCGDVDFSSRGLVSAAKDRIASRRQGCGSVGQRRCDDRIVRDCQSEATDWNCWI